MNINFKMSGVETMAELRAIVSNRGELGASPLKDLWY
jgi:hypothetical protein